MMRHKSIIFGFALWFLYPNSISGLYENNDNVINLRASQSVTVNSPYYPNYTYQPGSSGRYVITAPNGYQIRAECQINIPKVGVYRFSSFSYNLMYLIYRHRHHVTQTYSISLQITI